MNRKYNRGHSTIVLSLSTTALVENCAECLSPLNLDCHTVERRGKNVVVILIDYRGAPCLGLILFCGNAHI